MIEPITVYKCSSCGKIYHSEITECVDCSNKITVNKVVGPFKIIKRLELTKKFRVECLLCGFQKEVDQTNIKRQQSCGCKPRHVEVHEVTEDQVRYHCKRCGDITVEEVPLFSWCCTEESDE